MGLEAPSPAWPARDLPVGRGRGGAEPSKRPRAAWRRFDPPRPQRPPAGPDAGEYVLAGGRKAVIWPAPGRPLAPGGGLAGRPGRWPARRPSTSSTRARPPGARTRRPRGRQRRGPGPQPAPSHRPARPGRVRSPGVEPPAGRPYRPTTHGRQRALRPDPAPPPGPAAPGRLSRRAPGRRVDRFDHTPQHPAPPPGPARAHHPAAGLGRHRGGPGTPTGPRHRPHHPRRPNPRATRPPGADRRTGAGPSPPAASAKPAITRNGRRPHRRHRVPGPPRPGRAPNHRDPGRHHHHLRRRPRPAS